MNTPTQLDLFSGADCRPKAAHIFRKDPFGFYQEPAWVPVRLFEVEMFTGTIEDRACGVGTIPTAARAAGYEVIASDIIDRGFRPFDECVNFLALDRPRGNNLVVNPPFQICDAFLQHALTLGYDAIAMIWLTRRLNAARWLANTSLVRIWLLTPRPSIPPGDYLAAGNKAKGGTQDFCWLVFRRGHVGPPQLRWLHRDGGAA